MNTRRQNAGFSLIELLVALSLTVLVGGISYQFLDAVYVARETNTQAVQQIHRLERTRALLQADFEHAIDRPVRIPPGFLNRAMTSGTEINAAPAMIGHGLELNGLTELTGQPGTRLWLQRNGWNNPGGFKRSALQRVAYRVSEQKLYRDYWAERNQPLRAAPTGTLLLLDNVEDFTLRFLRASPGNAGVGTWLEQWPAAPVSSAEPERVFDREPGGRLPLAVEMRVETAEFGQINWLFTLAAG